MTLVKYYQWEQLDHHLQVITRKLLGFIYKLMFSNLKLEFFSHMIPMRNTSSCESFK